VHHTAVCIGLLLHRLPVSRGTPVTLCIARATVLLEVHARVRILEIDRRLHCFRHLEEGCMLAVPSVSGLRTRRRRLLRLLLLLHYRCEEGRVIHDWHSVLV